MQHRAASGIATCLLCAALLPGSALATTRTQLWVDPSFSGGIGQYSQALTGTGPLSLNGDGADGDISFGSGSSATDYGVIRMAGEFSGSGTTGARASFRDRIVFQAPGLAPGASVEVDYKVLIVGSLSVDAAPGNAVSQWDVHMGLTGGGWDAAHGGQLWNNSPAHVNADKLGYLGDPFGLLQATATVQIGANETLAIELEALAQATFQNGAQHTQTTAAFNLASSLYWGGIVEMRQAGAVITNFSAVGDTGIDWRQGMTPVPEPASGWLLAAGLAAAGGWRRLRA